MADEQTEPIEVAWTNLATLIKEKEALKLSFPDYLERLRLEADNAARKLEIAKRAAGICEETKPRRTRKDKGIPRAKKNAI